MLNYTKRYLLKNGLYKRFLELFDINFFNGSVNDIILSDGTEQQDMIRKFFNYDLKYAPHLEYAFPWDNSDEGFGFWVNVNNKILDFKNNIQKHHNQ